MEVRREALNWLKEAGADLRRAERSLAEGDYALSAFMAQQACEKALKAAYLALLRRNPPRTHDLVVLYRGLGGRVEVGEGFEGRLPEVSQYYVTARYPNAGLEVPSESISREQAERALEVARHVLGRVSSAIRDSGEGQEGH